MKTAWNEQERSDTTVLPSTGRNVEQIEVQAELVDTTFPAPKKGQTVPSSSCEGKVWLLYIPRGQASGRSEQVTKR